MRALRLLLVWATLPLYRTRRFAWVHVRLLLWHMRRERAS